jgi:hypothetical protein
MANPSALSFSIKNFSGMHLRNSMFAIVQNTIAVVPNNIVYLFTKKFNRKKQTNQIFLWNLSAQVI